MLHKTSINHDACIAVILLTLPRYVILNNIHIFIRNTRVNNTQRINCSKLHCLFFSWRIFPLLGSETSANYISCFFIVEAICFPDFVWKRVFLRKMHLLVRNRIACHVAVIMCEIENENGLRVEFVRNSRKVVKSIRDTKNGRKEFSNSAFA